MDTRKLRSSNNVEDRRSWKGYAGPKIGDDPPLDTRQARKEDPEDAIAITMDGFRSESSEDAFIASQIRDTWNKATKR